ncbi:MAG: hypothetical protein HWE10_12150 [Gammaproteobacteria bacterium]|nr:hypothetical protein [Gammaproteobacteria bacterium]
MIFKTKPSALLILLSLLISSCSIEEIDKEKEALFDNEKKWQAIDNGSYYFELSKLCFCSTESLEFSYHITPNKSLIYNRVIEQLVIENSEYQPQIETIDDLFEIAEKAQDEAYSVSIEYHPDYGVPTLIDIDWNQTYADDEIAYQISHIFPSADIACATYVAEGVNFQLVDSENQTSLNCQGEMRLQDGDWVEILNGNEGYCEQGLRGATERAGIYQVDVDVDGYQSPQVDDLHLMSDVCHVQQKEITIELIKE